MTCTSWRAYRAALGALLAMAMVVPAPAYAGGFATVGVTPPDHDASAGTPWNAVINVRQHGVTPLAGVKPKITIARSAGGGERTFAASPTSRPGVYRARVVFPSAGRWTYVVDDGFSMRHEFPAVTVGAAGAGSGVTAAKPDDGPDVWPALGAALAAGLLVASVVLVLGRRRPRGTPAAAGG
jgi:hypothetical protein